jgi:uncharacterized protein YuzE
MNRIYRTRQKPARLILSILLILSKCDMKVECDAQTDTLTITLREARIRESDEVRPGGIADFGYDGGVVRFEVLDASKVVDRTREMHFALAGA